jgi:predicted DNA binding CopG/RHH family protein
MIMYSKLYTEVVMKKDKNIMIRVSKSTHTAFKKKAAEEGATMSKIVREFVGRYLRGELELTQSD